MSWFSVVRRSLLPPAFSERLSPAQWTTGLHVHGVLCFLAALFDLVLLLVLKLDERIRQEVANTFALINVPTLLAAGTLAVIAARVPRLHRTWVVVVLVAAAVTTTVVWIQATGTLTSYFLIMGAVLVAAYRMYFGYRIGALALAMLAVLHAGAVGLEIAGLLEPEALFLSGSGPTYSATTYRLVVLSSILLVDWMTFFAASTVINKLKEKDVALAEARRQVSRLGGSSRGRLTGRMLGGELAVGERLGCGGFGEVYAATRLTDERRVAIKVLHPHLVQRDGFVERFRREVELLERIPPHHTAPLLGISVDDAEHAHYFAMELLTGEDLAAFTKRRGALAADEAVAVARGIAEALDAAHAAQVVHRDLKPANVFLADRGDPAAPPSVRLLDFGMSRALGTDDLTLTESNAMIGTFGYMAPEQALAQHDRIGPASDRFAFAAIMYRALTGQPAFPTTEPLAAIHEVVHVHPVAVSALRPDLPAQVDAVMRLGLAKRIEDRYPSAAAFVAELEAALAGRLSEEAHARTVTSSEAQAATLTSPPIRQAGGS